MHTLTLSGPAYPTHDTAFPDGWYITDTMAVGFLSDSHDDLDHMVGRSDQRVERVLERTDPVGEKSVTFIKHDNEYWVKEPWDLEQLLSFDNFCFVYDDSFIFQPLNEGVRTGELEELTGNNSDEGKTALKKFGMTDELLVLDRDDIAEAVNNDLIYRLQSAKQWEQF